MTHAWTPARFKRGVITGADLNQEWMLKKWFESYQKHHDEPVLFIDFGMSACAKAWCQKRGLVTEIKAIPPQDLTPKPGIPEAIHLKRQVWFQKPYALLASPFTQSIWVDIDCLFIRPITPLFDLIHPLSSLSMRLELNVRAENEQALGLVPEGAPSYNTGVFAYAHGSPLLTEWVGQFALSWPHHLGDQDALSAFLQAKKVSVTPMPNGAHTIFPEKVSKETLIYHFASTEGKAYLLEEGLFSLLAN